MAVSGKPIQLIKNVDGKLVVCKEAAEKLSSINGFVGIIASVGTFRSGKSFMMNRILGRSDGFRLSNLNESRARGIWIWDEINTHKNAAGQKMHLIVLDTEGFDSPDNTSEWDTKIFILTLLMSSVLIYNNKNVINRESIEKLCMMAKLANCIKFDDQKSSIADLPDLVWAVRDFCIKPDSSSYTDYFMNALEKEVNDENKRNYIQNSIKSCFKSLDCFTLPIPIDKDDNKISMEVMLQRLHTLTYTTLRPEFQYKMDRLCEKVKSLVAVKNIKSKPANGAAFIEFVENICKSLNENQNIYASESLTTSIRIVAESGLEKAIQHFNDSFDQYFQKDPLPIRWKEFDTTEKKIINSSFEILKNSMTGPEDIIIEYALKLRNYITTESNDTKQTKFGKLQYYRSKNSAAIYDFNKNILNELWNEKVKPLLRTPIKVHEFENIINEIESGYDYKALKGPEKPRAHQDFFEQIDISTTKASIQNWYSEYEKITEENKKNELLREELKRKKAKIQANIQVAEQEKIILEQTKKDENERHTELMESLNENLKNLEIELKSVKASNQTLINENKELNAKIENKKKAIHQLQEDKKKKDQNEQLDQKLNVLQQDVNNLSEKLATLNGNKTVLNEENRRLRGEISVIEEKQKSSICTIL